MTLSLAVSFDSDDHLRVLVTDATDANRWQIPESIVPVASSAAPASSLNYNLTYTASPFTFTVTRLSDMQVVFASSPVLVFKDQYLELTSLLEASNALFGIGESTRTAGLAVPKGSTSTLWARDMPAAAFDTNL